MADTPAGGGGQGYNIGGGYVTVGVDFSGARQEMAAFKQELGSYFAGSVVSPLGGGGLGAGNAAPAGGTQTGGVAGLPGIGMPTAGGFAGFAGMPGTPPGGIQPYEVNEFSGGGAFAMLPLGQTQWSMANQAYGGGGGLQMSFGGGGDLTQPAGGGGGGSGGRSGGGGGGGAGWMANLFRPSTLFRQIGLPVSAFYAALGAGRIAQGFEQSDFIANHPEFTQERYDQYGSGLRLWEDANTQSIIGQSQGIQETLAWRGARNSIPLLGQVAQAIDFGPGSSFQLQQRQARLDTQAGRSAAVASGAYATAALAAQNSGDPVAVARQGFAQELNSREGLAIATAAEAARAGGVLATAQSHLATGGNYAGTGAGYQGGSTSQADVAAAAAEFNRLTGEAAKAAAGLAEFRVEAGKAVGEIARQQGIATANVTAGTAAMGASHFGGVSGSEAAQTIMLRAAASAATNEYFTHPTALNAAGMQQADTALKFQQEQAASDFFDRNEQALTAFNNNYAASLAGSYSARFSFQTSQRSMITGVRAESLRAGNDPFGASLADLDAARERAEALPPLEAGPEKARLDAQERIMRARHGFDLDVFNDTSNAAIRAAGDRANFRPLTADAEMSVANARAEVANAPTDQRQKTIERLTAELATQSKLLTQQLGGQVAIDTNAYTAMGMPSALGLDLTGRQIDVTAAQRAYSGADLNSSRQAPQTQAGLTPTSLKEVISPILDFASRMKAITWPSAFIPG